MHLDGGQRADGQRRDIARDAIGSHFRIMDGPLDYRALRSPKEGVLMGQVAQFDRRPPAGHRQNAARQSEPSGRPGKDGQRALPSDDGTRNISFASSVVWQSEGRRR